MSEEFRCSDCSEISTINISQIMKKLFVSIFTVLLITSKPSTVQAQQFSQPDPAEHAQSIFQPTQEEKQEGVDYFGEGVYQFNLTGGDFSLMKRTFTLMLAGFRKNHPSLE